jgi:hypothetical protein
MKRLLTIIFLLAGFNLFAQDAIEYKTPPAAINDLVMAKLSPSVSFDRKGRMDAGNGTQQHAIC